MAPPLTKTTAQGVVYTRPPDVEAQIDEAAVLSPVELKRRLDVTKPERDGFLRPETLLHLLRRGIATGSMATFNVILPILLKRCERTLEAKIFNSLPSAAELREDILGAFAELLASDGAGRWCTDPRLTSSALCRLRFTLGAPNNVRSWALRRRACN